MAALGRAALVWLGDLGLRGEPASLTNTSACSTSPRGAFRVTEAAPQRPGSRRDCVIHSARSLGDPSGLSCLRPGRALPSPPSHSGAVAGLQSHTPEGVRAEAVRAATTAEEPLSPRDLQDLLLPPLSAGNQTPERGFGNCQQVSGGFIRSDIRVSRAPAPPCTNTCTHSCTHTCAHTAAASACPPPPGMVRLSGAFPPRGLAEGQLSRVFAAPGPLSSQLDARSWFSLEPPSLRPACFSGDGAPGGLAWEDAGLRVAWDPVAAQALSRCLVLCSQPLCVSP